MRIAIAGAGGVGRSIAAELLDNGHEVLLIDRQTRAIRVDALDRAEWLLADACELSSLEDARLEEFDVVVAATGDDKVNLVVSLLAKSEFGVGRVVARINDPANEWLFTSSWGVDVAVSPPRMMAALVEDATGVNVAGEAVSLMTLPDTDLVEFTLPDGAPHAGRPVRELEGNLPENAVLVAVVRNGHVRAPRPETVLEAGDDLVFLSGSQTSEELGAVLSPE
ncbi:potassium channel family protein [Marinactinospora thermotolerans]|uniref:Trk system potassium uptake protein TrkA n=1 Tax=Marinactinospora thermotolerans DSM 45154 TaxID=1122192 RepID=A0A1T4S746_9ACTN|nr:TrkA family potassium uptake protein [Marinactinospora thermotolerans]SKA23671.1 trk system potassium uptake protein TrkA [Marinactinospora thermotolerans DSM 45154]